MYSFLTYIHSSTEWGRARGCYLVQISLQIALRTLCQQVITCTADTYVQYTGESPTVMIIMDVSPEYYRGILRFNFVTRSRQVTHYLRKNEIPGEFALLNITSTLLVINSIQYRLSLREHCKIPCRLIRYPCQLCSTNFDG